MRKLFLFFIPFLAFSISVTVPVSVSRAQVLINEFLADPARDWDGDGQVSFRDDEWVEIVNYGESAVDLSGYLLTDGEGEPVWRYGFSGLLEPGHVRVVYGSDSRAWEQSEGFPVYGLSLNNTGDRLALYMVSGYDTVIVDEYTYEDKAAEDDRSVGRSAQDPESWAVFDAFNPCSENCVPEGNGCVPTPGSTNECLTGTQSESWGKIKHKYRG